MKDSIKITFFMLVTNKDIGIADYAIASFQKIYTKYYKQIPFKLLVYANCINEEAKRDHFYRWNKFVFVEVFDNCDKVKRCQFLAGEKIISPEGATRIREDVYEDCDELWSTELKKIQTSYFATVDADFEILNPDFIAIMLQELDRDSQAIGMSTDYSPTKNNVYESYSKRFITLHERWHTWFCIYKKEANKCNVSHFYYEFKNDKGKLFCLDSSANFQRHLIEDYGYKFLSVDQKYKKQYIHYGAFSKNKSIKAWNIGFYRALSILSARGLDVFHRIGQGDCIFNNVIKMASILLRKCFFDEKERTKYSFALKK